MSYLDLDNAQIIKDIGAIREDTRQELLSILTSFENGTCLILDNDFLLPLGLLVDKSELKELGVGKVFVFQDQDPKITQKNILFFIRPKKEVIEKVANYIKLNETNDTFSKKEFHIYFVPHKSFLCEKILEKQGVRGAVTINEFHFDLLNLDEDVFTLFLESSFQDYLSGDTTSLYFISSAINKLQGFFGMIPTVKYIGKNAKIVTDMLVRMGKDTHLDPSVQPKIHNLVVVDRMIDLITPMMIQLTYEGIIDELYEITNSYAEFEPKIIGKEGTKKEKYILNSNDVLFEELRDLNIGFVGEFLKQKARYIAEQYDQRHNLQEIRDISNFVHKLPGLQKEHFSLSIHLNILEDIFNKTQKTQKFQKYVNNQLGLVFEGNPVNEYVEEMMYTDESLVDVLRLLCLQSMVNNDFKGKVFDNFRKDIIQNYGFKHIFTLEKLAKLGMFQKRQTKGKGKMNFVQMKKILNLIDPNFDENKGISSVYSGYTPITARLIQKSIKSDGWKEIEEVLKQLTDGVYGEIAQQNAKSQNAPSENVVVQSDKKMVCFVFFVGGVTYSEISALRLLSQMEDSKYDFVVGTTQMINGKSLIESCFENYID
ncbi:vacuolar protein sorting-associated protein 33a [Anaeramoeba ignava]|uniref:Vacuolar protein sorting-associated protein 33a n=1 Tax=Anaeramoeba ignava TaxID=1746090 RepID=A0A9Q0LIW6_ANAIG|nr:vacuolar protein sorting-associated protein 33a [Anaeramoeba ignava]